MEFDYEIVSKKGKQNCNADAVSYISHQNHFNIRNTLNIIDSKHPLVQYQHCMITKFTNTSTNNDVLEVQGYVFVAPPLNSLAHLCMSQELQRNSNNDLITWTNEKVTIQNDIFKFI